MSSFHKQNEGITQKHSRKCEPISFTTSISSSSAIYIIRMVNSFNRQNEGITQKRRKCEPSSTTTNTGAALPFVSSVWS